MTDGNPEAIADDEAGKPKWFMADLIAGVTLSAYAIPVSMAYATLAGLPSQSGIYCYLVGGLAYALLGSSRQLAIGPTSAIAMVVGITIADMAQGDLQRWTEIAALTAFVVAGLCGLAWLLRLNTLTSFVSETILMGFKAGAALTIAMSQLPKLFGVTGGGEHFFERLWILLQQLPKTDPLELAFGLFAILLLLVGEKRFPGRPVALAIVVLSILIVSLGSLEQRGIHVVGALPQGLPELRMPSLRLRDVDGVIPLACACFLLSYIESISAARALAAKHGYTVDPRRELLGLALANFSVAFAQGFPVAGGLSQSTVNANAGARSRWALVVASITLGICLLYLTNVLRSLPSVVLAAVVLVAVKGLIDIQGLRRLRQVSRYEFRIAIFALVGVLLLGILKGVMLATIVSLLMLIAAVARPTVAFLGRIPGTKRYSDLQRHPDNEQIPGALIVRVESALLYFNIEHVLQVIQDKIKSMPPLKLVVFDLSSSPYVDVAGAQGLATLQEALQSQQTELRLVEAHANVRDALRASGLEKSFGHIGRQLSLDQLVSEFEAARFEASIADSLNHKENHPSSESTR